MLNTGTQLKFSMSLTLPSGLTMDSIRFEVVFYCIPSKTKSFLKSDMTRVDENTYTCILDTNDVGEGNIKAKVTAYIPDGSIERPEINTIDTNAFTVNAKV